MKSSGLEGITTEHCLDVFGDFAELPSYLEIASRNPASVTQLDAVPKLMSAVRLATERIATFPGLARDKSSTIETHILLETFNSSNGSEARFVASGLKPVSLTSVAYDEAIVKTMFGPVPLKYTSSESIYIDSGLYPHLGFDFGMLEAAQSPACHAGFLYNRGAVEAVTDRNRAIFQKLGHTTVGSPEAVMESVFNSGTHPVAESIVMGYSPFSAIFFYLLHPEDVTSESNPRGFAARRAFGKGARAAGYWEELEGMLSTEQLALAHQILANPAAASTLRVLEDTVGYKDYMDRTRKNLRAQSIWRATGMDRYLTRQRYALFNDPSELTLSGM